MTNLGKQSSDWLILTEKSSHANMASLSFPFCSLIACPSGIVRGTTGSTTVAKQLNKQHAIFVYNLHGCGVLFPRYCGRRWNNPHASVGRRLPFSLLRSVDSKEVTITLNHTACASFTWAWMGDRIFYYTLNWLFLAFLVSSAISSLSHRSILGGWRRHEGIGPYRSTVSLYIGWLLCTLNGNAPLLSIPRFVIT